MATGVNVAVVQRRDIEKVIPIAFAVTIYILPKKRELGNLKSPFYLKKHPVLILLVSVYWAKILFATGAVSRGLNPYL